MEPQIPERIYQAEPLPDMTEIREFIKSKKAIKAFDSLIDFIEENYNFDQEIFFGGDKFGVMIRYRNNGKTLVSIFPEKNAFSVILIYGKKEVILFNNERDSFNPFFTTIFDETPQLHDGRWMLIRLEDDKLISDLIKMILIKKSVKKR